MRKEQGARTVMEKIHMVRILLMVAWGWYCRNAMGVRGDVGDLVINLRNIIGTVLIILNAHAYFSNIHIDFQTAYKLNCFHCWCHFRC